MSELDKLDALTHLAGAVAHELNNIFTAVNGNLSLLEMAFEDAGTNTQIVNDVLRTTRRGLELSEKLQAFAGQQKLSRALVDLNDVTRSTIAELKHSVLKGLEVEMTLASRDCLASTDEKKLRQVIEELARNAAAAMEPGGWIIFATGRYSPTDAEAGTLPGGEYAYISVRDCGHGMSPAVTQRALDPLFSTRRGHHGWGLARCAGFVRQCGGKMILNSVEGRGTEATVYLPLSPENRATSAAVA